MTQPAPLPRDVDGPIAVVVPHMDDEALGCGMFLAAQAARNAIHIFFCGEGLGSFSREFVAARGRDALVALRREEGVRAAGLLGVDPERVTFGAFREWKFRAQTPRIQEELYGWLDRVRPAVVLTPFRMDCHPDHTVLSGLTRAWATRRDRARLLEYFVYYRLRLIPGGDVRDLIDARHLLDATAPERRETKERAIRAYASQTTNFDSARPHPVLDDAFIRQAVEDRELLLEAPFENAARWMRWSGVARMVSRWQFTLKHVRNRMVGGTRHY